MSERLLCPRCSSAHSPQERFCPECGMPLVGEGEAVASPRQRLARKVKPQYTEGELVRVAGARNLAEAEFLQGMLLEEGVPSLLRRTAGFDVPDYLAAGPRDVLVPASGAGAAREVLLEAEIISPSAGAPQGTPPLRLLAGILVVLMLGAAVIVLAGRF